MSYAVKCCVLLIVSSKYSPSPHSCQLGRFMPKQVIVPNVSYLLPAVTKTCNPGLAEAMLEDDELDFEDDEDEAIGAMSKHTLTWTVTAG